MSVSISTDVHEHFYLVQITFGAEVWRFCTTLGQIVHGGNTWFDSHDTNGRILGLSPIEDGQDLPNMDLKLELTSALLAHVQSLEYVNSEVRIWSAVRDLSTYVVTVSSSYLQFYLHEFTDLTHEESVTFVLGKGQHKQDLPTYSSAYRNTLHSLTDTAFDMISGVQSAPQTTVNWGGGNDYKGFNFV